MKKILAMLLAVTMMLSVSAVAFGEAAEAAEPVQYSTFEEHLEAFMSNLNLQEKDLYMVASANDQTYQLLIGQDDNGVINMMAGQDNQIIGNAQFDSEAAYLKYQDSIMAIQYATVQSFIQNLPDKLMGYLKAMGIDPQQIMADVQTLMVVGQKMMEKIQPAYKQSVEGSVVTITLDGELYGELYAQALEEALADPAFQAILARYIPMFGGQYDPDQVSSAWQSVRPQIVEITKTWVMVFTIDQSSGEMTMKADCGLPENAKMTMDFVANTANNAMNLNGNMVLTSGEQEIKYEKAMNLEKNSFWLDFPNKGTTHVVMYQNGQESVAMDMAYELNDAAIPQTILVTMSQQGREMVRMQYADSTFAAYAQGQEMLYCQYKDKVLTMRAQGSEIVLRETENDADHMVYEMAMTSSGHTMTAYITYTIAVDGAGAEFLQLDVQSEGNTELIAQVLQTEKQAFSLLKDEEAINWITEDQLDSLLDNAVQSAMSQIMSQFRR